MLKTPVLTCFSFLFFKFYLFIFRQRGKERKREGEKHQCVVASHAPPTEDLACNPGMYPDWELNQWPFGSQARTQPTEPHQPGTNLLFLAEVLPSVLVPPLKSPDTVNRWESEFKHSIHTEYIVYIFQKENQVPLTESSSTAIKMGSLTALLWVLLTLSLLHFTWHPIYT